MSDPELSQLREQISALDEKLLQLLAERRQLTTAVAETKIAKHIEVRDKTREQELLLRLIQQGQAHQLDAHYVTKLFQVIIEDSVLNQQALLSARANPQQDQPLQRVAFLGSKGSYSHLATCRYFSRRPGELHEMGCQSFEEIFDKVENGAADYALLPIENTSSGSINEVYDLLQHTRLSIVGEITQAVEHALLVAKDTNLESLRQVYGHPQALAQCRQFLNTLEGVERINCDSTSAAMAQVAELQRDDCAAIGSAGGGQVYGLSVLKGRLANQSENHSRFIVVARKAVKVPLQVPAKTTLVMSTMQKSGSLVDALLVLKNNDISMTKLESRPITGNPWEEMFYLDVDGNVDDGPLQQALEDLAGITRSLKVLGCYPSEDIVPTKVAAAKALQDNL